MRQFRRLQRIRLRTTAQKRCPPDFARRILVAYAAHPAVWNGRAMIGHDPRCNIVRGGTCNCQPDIHLTLPDGALVEIGRDGGMKRETRQ
jgi:hypothetical protein